MALDGTKLGRYEIRSQLGAGGMGEVYLAQDTKLDRKVALKILPAEVAANLERMRRFTQEAKAAAALNHPNIAHVYEIDEVDGLHFIAMEFIEGETLRRHMARYRMNVREVLEVALQVAGALAEAHQAGIIHRDIKPENIMLRPSGLVKVLDFGLAKLVDQQTPTTDTEAPTIARVDTDAGTVMGTVNYMSPEQARGRTVDARSDLFSVGVVIYEMAAGRVPFDGESASDIIASLLKSEPSPLVRYIPEAPAELERIVSKALAKDIDERYQSAKDLLIDLKRLKQRQEVEAEIERSVSPETMSRAAATTGGGKAVVATGTESRPKSGEVSARTTSSAEYLVSEIKRHKLAALVALFVFALAIVGLIAYLRATNPEVAIESIAVLPFENQNRDPDMEYRSDGLTESIINSLTQLQNLRVIARSSVFRYKGKETDPLAAGKELGVRAVLTGRILQHGDELTVSAELVDVRENKQLWGERYERKISDLLAVQREIAKEIYSNLRLKLSGVDESRVTKHYTDNPEAYQLYLKGRFYWNRRTGEAIRKSIEYFQQAIEKDPGYALAYAGLADAYVLLPTYSAGSPRDSYSKAKGVAKIAVDMDETLAEAHTSLAYALILYDWNSSESNREFERAIELNPMYATAHHWHSIGLRAVGRFDESIAEIRRAQELDPLSLIINADLGTDYIYARQYDKAIAQLRETIQMDPTFYYAHWRLGIAHEMKVSLQNAVAEYQTARQLNDDPSVVASLGRAFAGSGKKDEALRMLEQLKEFARQRYVSAYSFALVYAALGGKDQAFQWLEKSYQDRAFDLAFLKVDPLLDNLRSDPRFADLVRRVGL